MRAVVQRVSRAEVRVGGVPVAGCALGLLVLLAVGKEDGPADVDYIVEKVAHLRIFEDGAGKMNLSVADVGGSVVVVSQFTLLADCRKGRRPSFSEAAAPPETAEALYLEVARKLGARGIPVQTGRFRAEMEVELVNAGPVTMLLDSQRVF